MVQKRKKKKNILKKFFYLLKLKFYQGNRNLLVCRGKSAMQNFLLLVLNLRQCHEKFTRQCFFTMSEKTDDFCFSFSKILPLSPPQQLHPPPSHSPRPQQKSLLFCPSERTKQMQNPEKRSDRNSSVPLKSVKFFQMEV